MDAVGHPGNNHSRPLGSSPEFRMDLDSRGPGLDFRYVDWTWTGPGLGLSPGPSPRKKFLLDKIDLDNNKIKIEFKGTP